MSDTVEITVGREEEEKTFTIHSAILGQSSEFFIEAMKPESPSCSPPSTIVIAAGEPATFGIYFHWLYFKTLPTIIKDQEKQGVVTELCILSKCYVLGERLFDIRFKNAILNAFTGAFTEADATLYSPYTGPGKDPITTIYEGTRESSPARELLLKLWANHTTSEWVHCLDDTPTAFKVDLIDALMWRRKWLMGEVDSTEFHESLTPSKESWIEEADIVESGAED